MTPSAAIETEEFFNLSVLLPPSLHPRAIQLAIDRVEHEASRLHDLHDAQPGWFSIVVADIARREISASSVYEKHRHPDIAQQRFPDLRKRGSGLEPSAEESLEVKASKRPWPVQSHYNHAGWYIVFRYLVDPTRTVAASPVVVWRVDVAFLTEDDWKYEGSSAGAGGGGRTHTFGVIKPATKLRDCAFYQRSDIVLKGGKPLPQNGN